MGKRRYAREVIKEAGQAIANLDRPLPADPFISMVERAARDATFDVQKFQALLSERDKEARRLSELKFGEALAQAKRHLPTVIKSREVNLGGNRSYKYEDFNAVATAVDPTLTEHGLAYRFRTQSDASTVTVTCILFGHGHSEENSLTAPPDTSGAKNAVQAIGSIVTYLQRYTLKAALGIAASIDDDGRAANGTGHISAEQVKELRVLLQQRPPINEKTFCDYLGTASLENLPSSKFGNALTELQNKRKDMAG
jgi:ERF superfamily